MNNLLQAIRHAVPCWEYVFKHGGCYGLYLIIKSVYPEAECWYDQIEGHVYTKVGGEFWDIDGQHEPKEHWIRIESEPNIHRQAETWICDKFRETLSIDKARGYTLQTGMPKIVYANKCKN